MKRDELYVVLTHQESLLQGYRSFLFVFVSIIISAKTALYALYITFDENKWMNGLEIFSDPRIYFSLLSCVSTLSLLVLVRRVEGIVRLRERTVSFFETMILMDEFDLLRNVGSRYEMIDHNGSIKSQTVIRYLSRSEVLPFMGENFRQNILSFISKVDDFRFDAPGKSRSVMRSAIYTSTRSFLIAIFVIDIYVVLRELTRSSHFV